ncbi:unnamed protein product [Paramecium sonneborni]|uniref:Uncharacterized protein n=1 Tax=Paramecium sonneborni TaxID=65129 RepID=A0A8S1PV59_9CILI|nr:unnamed protein product [Paramecium sonneborni]
MKNKNKIRRQIEISFVNILGDNQKQDKQQREKYLKGKVDQKAKRKIIIKQYEIRDLQKLRRTYAYQNAIYRLNKVKKKILKHSEKQKDRSNLEWDTTEDRYFNQFQSIIYEKKQMRMDNFRKYSKTKIVINYKLKIIGLSNPHVTTIYWRKLEKI